MLCRYCAVTLTHIICTTLHLLASCKVLHELFRGQHNVPSLVKDNLCCASSSFFGLTLTTSALLGLLSRLEETTAWHALIWYSVSNTLTNADLTLSAFERLRADVMWKPVIAALGKETWADAREQAAGLCQALALYSKCRSKVLPSGFVRRLQACFSILVGHSFVSRRFCG